MPDRDVLIVGAGPAGLACAAALGNRGIPAAVLEQAESIAPVWRRHYKRLHLHTDKKHSALPGLAMPRDFPRYPARDEVVDYLETYATHHRIRVETGVAVGEIIREHGGWGLRTSQGTRRAHAVIVATGIATHSHRPVWPGSESFPGEVLHSSDYASADAFEGKRVLVVGFGNSGGEIACDLAEHGVDTALSVRGPVNVIPREILGIPILSWAIAEKHLPYRLADRLNAALIRWTIGDIRRYGLTKADKGPLAQVIEDGRVPLIDVGTMKGLRQGDIRLRPGIDRIERARIEFTDGASAQVDVIIQATGYRPDLRSLLPDTPNVLDGAGCPKTSGAASNSGGLYLCNFVVAPTGQLREAGIEAEAIAESIVARISTDAAQ